MDLCPGEDLYAIVGVTMSASPTEIRAAYRRRARILHPDVNATADAPREFRRLSAATAILLSPQRDRWDSEGVAEWPMDMEWSPSSGPRSSDGGWMSEAKAWGPIWTGVIGPWFSWYAFVALDKFFG